MNKTDLSTYDNSWYHPGRGFVVRLVWYYVNALFFKCSWNVSSGLKVWLLRLFGAKVGKGVTVKPCVNIKYPWLLEVGNHVWIGENVWIDNLAKVSIADHVCISQSAMLFCGNHNYASPSFDLMVLPITIEEGAWVCARCTVCPGVTLHSHSILVTGSVATKDLEAMGIYRGNPAEKIKERTIG